MLRAIVTGAIGTYAVGGVAWDYGQYALGLERLGAEVTYLEDTGLAAYDASTRTYSDDSTYAVGFLRRSLAALSPTLGSRWAYRAPNGSLHGMDEASLAAAVACADVFVNVSGLCLLRDCYMACPRRVLIDTDPGWNHFVNFPAADRREPQQGLHGWRDHTHFLTYARNLGEDWCPLPTLGVRWQPTRPPVVVDMWPVRRRGTRWTTVLTWDNYGKPIVTPSAAYGSKELEFGHIEDVPRSIDTSMEVAVGGQRAPSERWRSLGWTVVDSTSVTRTVDDYRAYVTGSIGEFSVAKNVYVATRSGWFSCRSVCYLASGRPVVVQDTGFSRHIPTGSGLLPFSTRDQAIDALRSVDADWSLHSAAATELARSEFDSRSVLHQVLDHVGGGDGGQS